MSEHYQVVVVGGGAAGITVSAWLLNSDRPPASLAIIEPSDKHYYQPLWTLVGGGVFPKQASERDEGDFIPDGATWIRDRVRAFDPERSQVITERGETIGYDVLVVAPGIELHWDGVRGLRDAIGKDGVCSIYSYDTVDAVWRTLRGFSGGRAVFTFPHTTIKCGGAPQKIMWLAEHHLRRAGTRDAAEVVYASATAGIFGVDRYARPLRRLVKERGVITRFERDLVEIRPRAREAVFADIHGRDDALVLSYDMLHVTPPMRAPRFVAESALADAAGWVDVDKHTMQHARYANVFSLGDASSLPCAKTGAAIRKQAPLCAANITAFLAGEPLQGRYDGYASCPLITGYGRLILAEFGYGGVPMETFPFAQDRERYSMWALKTQGLPRLYWHGMLRGRV